MDAPDDTGARIIRRLEELLQQSTLPPETVLNMLRRPDAKSGIDPLGECRAPAARTAKRRLTFLSASGQKIAKSTE